MGNEKGGCGKTTISTNLAAAAAGAGRSVLLVDSDPGQQSAAKWAAVRRANHPNLPSIRCVSLTTPQIAEEIRDFSRQYDWVVVDTGAEDSPQLRGAACLANVLVVPVQPDELDLWTLPAMGRIATGARQINSGLSLLIALNRCPHQTVARLQKEVSTWIVANAPGLEKTPLVTLVGRTAYGKASGDGMGVQEPANSDAKAAAEIARLYLEVSRHDKSPLQKSRAGARAR